MLMIKINIHACKHTRLYIQGFIKATCTVLYCTVVHTLSFFNLLLNQDFTYGSQPRSLESLYTIPQRLTVAGEATARSSTSNNKETYSTNTIQKKKTCTCNNMYM